MTDRMLIFKLELQDLLNTIDKVKDAIESGKVPDDFNGQSSVVAESRVISLCGGCDHNLGVDEGCRIAGKNNQRRYASRGNCGWASVDGKRTTRTI